MSALSAVFAATFVINSNFGHSASRELIEDIQSAKKSSLSSAFFRSRALDHSILGKRFTSLMISLSAWLGSDNSRTTITSLIAVNNLSLPFYAHFERYPQGNELGSWLSKCSHLVGPTIFALPSTSSPHSVMHLQNSCTDEKVLIVGWFKERSRRNDNIKSISLLSLVKHS